MRVSLVSALAQHLNVEEGEAADTLQEIVSQIREGVARHGQVDVPEVGTFSASNGEIEFTPAAELIRTVNADLEGLSPVILPASPQKQGPASESAEEELEALSAEQDDLVDSPEYGLADEFELDALEDEMPEAEIEGWEAADSELTSNVPEPELPDTALEGAPEAGDAVRGDLFDEYAQSEEGDEGTGSEFVSVEDGPWPPPPVGLPESDDLPAEEELPPELRGEEEEVEPIEELPLETSVFTQETSDERAAADEPQAEEPVEPAVIAGESTSAARAGHPPVVPAERADRPPEMHARPREVTEKKKRKKRRSLLPLFLMGSVLIGVVALAYFLFVGGGNRSNVIALEDVGPSRLEEPMAGSAEELEDALAEMDELAEDQPVDQSGIEGVGTAEQQPVASPPATVGDEPARQDPAPSGAAERAFDVTRGGWTVVVGSEATPEEAHELAETFRRVGHDTAVARGTINGVSRYRIIVNQFTSQSEAEAFLRSSPAGFPSDAWLTPVRSNLEIVPSP